MITYSALSMLPQYALHLFTKIREKRLQILYTTPILPKHLLDNGLPTNGCLPWKLPHNVSPIIYCLTVSVLTMANKDSCIKPCTRKSSGWQQSHKPPNLKGVYNIAKPVTFVTFASGATVHTPCLSAATFDFANHFQSNVKQDP
jgi:hypothetical protein